MSAPLARPIERLAGLPALDRPAEALASATAGRSGAWLDWARGGPLGHPLHPALTDLPIGFWTSAWVLDLLGGSRTRGAARGLVGWGVLSALPTLATGLTDVATLPTTKRRVAAVHAAANAVAMAGFAWSWWQRRRGRHTAGVATGLGAGALASLGGYLGGWLALGSDDAGDHHDGAASPPGDESAALAQRVADRLAGRQVACAESCTAGRIASALAAAGDAADFFRGSLVGYQEQVKREQLDVTAESVYSAEAAEEMALAVCRLLGADAAVATSGVLGDEPQDGVPPGTVFIATAVDGRADAQRYRFDGSPAEICEEASDQALRDLAAALDRAAARARQGSSAG